MARTVLIKKLKLISGKSKEWRESKINGVGIFTRKNVNVKVVGIHE